MQYFSIVTVITEVFIVVLNMTKETVLDKFWDQILKLVYVSEDNDPVQVWQERKARLGYARCIADYRSSLHRVLLRAYFFLTIVYN